MVQGPTLTETSLQKTNGTIWKGQFLKLLDFTEIAKVSKQVGISFNKTLQSEFTTKNSCWENIVILTDTPLNWFMFTFSTSQCPSQLIHFLPGKPNHTFTQHHPIHRNLIPRVEDGIFWKKQPHQKQNPNTCIPWKSTTILKMVVPFRRWLNPY